MSDRFFKITEQKKCIPSEIGFFTATNHERAMRQVSVKTFRVFNERFREIEDTGHFYYVEEQCTNGKTFIFEVKD